MQNIRFPKLSKIIPGSLKQKPKTPEVLKKLLLPREELELEDVSLSGSELSDAFAELHKENCSSSTKDEKPLRKGQADRLITPQFTDDFKQTMLNIREELQLGDNMITENIEDIEKILHEHREPKNLPESLQERIDELLKDREYICSTPSQISEDAPGTRKGSSIGFDVMSGVWRMLAVRDTKEKFRISSPSFNAFRQEEPHWLEGPPVPWKTLDISKHKCEKWLKEQQDN